MLFPSVLTPLRIGSDSFELAVPGNPSRYCRARRADPALTRESTRLAELSRVLSFTSGKGPIVAVRCFFFPEVIFNSRVFGVCLVTMD